MALKTPGLQGKVVGDRGYIAKSPMKLPMAAGSLPAHYFSEGMEDEDGGSLVPKGGARIWNWG